MSFPIRVLSMLLLGGMLAPFATAEDDDVKLTVDQLPAAVKATLMKQANGAVLSDFEKEKKKGKVVYTAEIPGTKKGEVTEFAVAEDGTLVSTETEQDDGDAKGGKDGGDKGK